MLSLTVDTKFHPDASYIAVMLHDVRVSASVLVASLHLANLQHCLQLYLQTHNFEHTNAAKCMVYIGQTIKLLTGWNCTTVQLHVTDKSSAKTLQHSRNF